VRIVKPLIVAWAPLLVALAVLGCSKPEKPKVAQAPKDGGAGPSQTDASKAEEKAGDLTPDELAHLLMGDQKPSAKPEAKPQPLPEGTIALGPNLLMTVPKGWLRKQPRVRIIDYEFAVPAAEGDSQGGRVTVTVAGGGIDANLQRWYGQFTQPDGSKTSDKAKVEQQEIAGHKVHLVDISGTYAESMGGGPFAPGKVTERPAYRMLAAIIETPSGLYFIKFYGPQKTVAAGAAAFRKMIEGLKRR
jgi:hypothetical protein